jgi:hypothetical protein
VWIGCHKIGWTANRTTTSGEVRNQPDWRRLQQAGFVSVRPQLLLEINEGSEGNSALFLRLHTLRWFNTLLRKLLSILLLAIFGLPIVSTIRVEYDWSNASARMLPSGREASLHGECVGSRQFDGAWDTI